MAEAGTILITGATGFIGRALASALSQTHEVVCLVRRLPGESESASSGIICQDLSEPLAKERFPEKLDTVVHLAQASGEEAADPESLFAVNTMSTVRLLEYGRSVGLKRFILASTGSVYGSRREEAREEDPVAPDDLYSSSKAAAEQMVALYKSHFPTITLRIFRPYGPGQRDRLIPSLVRRVLSGEPVTLVNGGMPAFQPIYVEDLIAVFQACLVLEESHVLNVAGPEATNIKGVSEAIGRMVGRTPIYQEVTDPLAADSLADSIRLQEVLGFAPSVGVAQGLERTVSWLMEHHPASATEGRGRS